MSMKKSFGIAFVTALALGASGAALANPITVGGVTWDPNSPLDLNIQALNLRETAVTGVGDVLHGYGQIGSINGNNSFCSGCDLTFTFTYTVQDLGPGGSGNLQAIFTNGSINFFVSNPGTYVVTNPTTAGLGTSWLTLTGHTGMLSGFTGTGQLFSNINGTAADPTSGSNGYGYLDATGGPAASYMQTHKIDDGMGGFADFSINSSFLTQIFKGCGKVPSTNLDNMCAYPISGTALQIGQTVKVPEPGEIGLLGLGLGALALMIRRRRKEIEE